MSLKTRENDIIAAIELDLHKQTAQISKESRIPFGETWNRVKGLSSKFINKDLSVNKKVLQNFRALNIFSIDVPTHKDFFKRNSNLRDAAKFKNERLELVELYEIAKEKRLNNISILDFLKKNPCDLVGNPNVFSYKGCFYTRRWLRQIWPLLLFRHFLGPRLESSFSFLDVGSKYGLFSYLLKKEYPRCSQILVDFPEMLAAAHYYLGMSFPNAKIASYKDVAGVSTINRDFVKKFDFILLPIFFYNKIERDIVDVFSSISSLWGMSREWFEYYMKSELFLSAKYFFCMGNQMKSDSSDANLTILDYKLKTFRKLYFRIEAELFPHNDPKSVCFHFIGQRIQSSDL